MGNRQTIDASCPLVLYVVNHLMINKQPNTIKYHQRLDKKTNFSITCNQNSNEDSPKQKYNHHEKDHSSSAKSEPGLNYHSKSKKTLRGKKQQKLQNQYY